MTARLGLEGRSALVVGGTSEIGAACVRRLCAEGMTVAFTGASRQRGQSIACDTGGAFLQADPRDRESCDRATERALELAGRLDVLVTHAGMVPAGSLEATDEAAFRDLLEGNLTSLFRVGRVCFEHMGAQGGGSMIAVGSAAGIRADHHAAAYSVASAGVIALAELFAADGTAHGIRCNAVCPGDVAGADVAALVAWLACDESAQLSGATLRLDGGSSAAMLLDTRT